MIMCMYCFANNTQKIKNGNEVLFRFHFLGVGSLFGGGFYFTLFLANYDIFEYIYFINLCFPLLLYPLRSV